VKVSHNSVLMSLLVPNALCRYRAVTFSTKEPDTLRWLDSIPPKAILWDVGANIGIYSIYAAKRQNVRVISFEPSVFNLELLARNIHLNNLQDQIQIVPIALTDSMGFSLFRMTNTAWGGALSTFGQAFDQNGMVLNASFEYSIIGISMDQAVETIGIPLPNFLKIDVDGIEHLILRGGASVLAHVESVLVEINDDFEEQASESAYHLRKSGLKPAGKFSLNSNNQYNQLWTR
jgi:FkbM family methyltransferase